jgi:hypothetical protein
MARPKAREALHDRGVMEDAVEHGRGRRRPRTRGRTPGSDQRRGARRARRLRGNLPGAGSEQTHEGQGGSRLPRNSSIRSPPATVSVEQNHCVVTQKFNVRRIAKVTFRDVAGVDAAALTLTH